MPAIIGKPGKIANIADLGSKRTDEKLTTLVINCFLPHYLFQRLPCPVSVCAAPTFTAQAVVDGDFKTVSLSDYKGK